MSVVKKILDSQTIGCEWPRPEIGVFHLIFLFAFHADGTPVSEEIPFPSPPRHCDQLVLINAAPLGTGLNMAKPARLSATAENSRVDLCLIRSKAPVLKSTQDQITVRQVGFEV